MFVVVVLPSEVFSTKIESIVFFFMLNLIYKWPKHAVRVQNTLPVMYNSDVQQNTRGLDEKVVVHVYIFNF